jgi:aldehyde:ferredoxin oxidoreductase
MRRKSKEGYKMYGWTGTVLRVDLTERKIVKQALDPKLAEDYLGGEGLGVRYLYDETPAGMSPFDPRMVFVVGIGPLTGTLCPSSGRLEVISKSPITGYLGDSNGGGHFAPEVKWAGYDSIVITGKAEHPVYLWICDDHVELRDARHLWGKKNRHAVRRQIRAEINEPLAEIMDIGIAGERQIALAATFSGATRAAGKTGVAAILGSKNLKAIAVKGTRGVRLADPEGFLQASHRAHEQIRNSEIFDMFKETGTIGLQDMSNLWGLMLGKNFQLSWLPPEKFEPISASTWLEKFKVKNYGCFNCPMHCGHWARVTEGPYAGLFFQGVEYYSQAIFLNNLGVLDDASFALKCTAVCDELGLCVGNTGHFLAYIAELYQRNLISREDLDGIDLRWGNKEAFLALIERLGTREGCGDFLGDGFDQTAKKIEKGADRYLMTVLGQVFPAVDVRYRYGWALSMLTSTRGADHLKGSPYAENTAMFMPSVDESARKYLGICSIMPDVKEGKDKLIKFYENICAIVDSVGSCKFVSQHVLGLEGGLHLDHYAEMLSTATGVPYDRDRLELTAERIHRLERAYNAREGLRRAQMKLPRRMVLDKITEGPHTGDVMNEKEIDELLDSYLILRGVDPETGIPTRKGLEEVGLKDIADDMEKIGILTKTLKKKNAGQKQSEQE